ncbi:trifunctional histidinol dehydrogenase [Recurvomyces mirabilis]|nr:trifunctional histidinol dehydrogenase [Recurvomyces mirabilis]
MDDMARVAWLELEIMVRKRKSPAGQVEDPDAVSRQLNACWTDANGFLPRFKDEIYGLASTFLGYQDVINTAHREVEVELNKPPRISLDPNGGSRFPDTTGFEEEPVVQQRIGALQEEREQIDEALQPTDDDGDGTTQDPPVDALLREWLQDELVGYGRRREEINAELRRQQCALMDLQSRNRALGVDWVGGWVLGKGSYGLAQAWIKRDNQNCVVDRVVIKDSSSRMKKDWCNDQWGTDPRDPEGRDTLPNEILAMYGLRGRQGADTIVHIRNARLLLEQRRMLLYLEYCPYGDVYRWADSYTESTAKMNTEKAFQQLHASREQMEHRWLPEAFLWSIFESLAISALLLEHGELGANPMQDWNPIYHLDYKASNVLLGVPSKQMYRGYPLAKLTDFGLCWIPDRHTVLQPDEQVGTRGTPYNAAPEQIEHVYDQESQRRLINAKVNVWGVGIVMWSLIEHEEGDHRLAFDNSCKPIQDYDEGVLEPQFRGPAERQYSQVLLGLISAATHYLPEDRLDARELLRHIRRNTGGSGGHDYAGGMRNAVKDSDKWQAPDMDMVSFLRKDAFAIIGKVPLGAITGDLVPKARKPPSTMSMSTLDPFGELADDFRVRLSEAILALVASRDNSNGDLDNMPVLSGSWDTGFSYPDDWQDEIVLLRRLYMLTSLHRALEDAQNAGTDLLETLQSRSVGVNAQAWLDGKQWIQDRLDEIERRLNTAREDATAVQEATWRVRRNKLGLGEAWVGGWSLGEGSFGMATGWYKRNDQDTIIDRIVVKESSDKLYGTGTSDKEYSWSDDPRDSTGKTILPNEIAAMYSLRDHYGAENIVAIRNSRLISADRSARIYMEYCPYGDLEKFSSWYWRATGSLETEEVWEDFHEEREYVEHKHLPEPFLWSVFESLACSGLLMEQAENPIYHLDYKTSNVLLGVESKDRYVGYPLAKLTDFGLSWIPNRSLEADPYQQKRGAGTVFNSAPEQIPVMYDGDTEPRLIDARTNVWGAGIVMWSLIEGEEGEHRLSWEHRNERPPGAPGRMFPQDCDPTPLETPEFRAAARRQYSRPLLDLIVQAVAYEQEDRPSFRELLDAIHDHTGEHPNHVDRAQGMRQKHSDSLSWSEGRDAMWGFLHEDKYALFAKLPKLPVPPKLDAKAWRTPPLRQELIDDDEDQAPVGGGPWPGLRKRGRRGNKRTRNDVEDDADGGA